MSCVPRTLDQALQHVTRVHASAICFLSSSKAMCVADGHTVADSTGSLLASEVKRHGDGPEGAVSISISWFLEGQHNSCQALTVSVAILAQGTCWAVAATQASCFSALSHQPHISANRS